MGSQGQGGGGFSDPLMVVDRTRREDTYRVGKESCVDGGPTSM